MTTNSFYESVPVIERISDVTDASYYRDIPEDWHIAVTDIRNSTQAIEEGRYKQVNAVAAASIAAMLNAAKADLPFVFGGDGASFLTPPETLDAVKKAMLGTQRLSSEHFGLYLRSAIVPIKEILAAGHAVQVTRMQVSENFTQAIFAGGGISYAEQIAKDPNLYRIYAARDLGGQYEVDFSGFECRWNEIPAAMGETISLLIQATAPTFAERADIYRDVLLYMEDTFGNREMRHPIRAQDLQLSSTPSEYFAEAVFRHNDASFGRRLFMATITWIFGQAMKYNISNWGAYKQIAVAATDNEKFDDTIRMIISGTSDKRHLLESYLEQYRQAGQLVYGIHASTHTLMTCIVYNHFGKQMHFVDGANGGYVQASKQLKAQLQTVTAT